MSKIYLYGVLLAGLIIVLFGLIIPYLLSAKDDLLVLLGLLLTAFSVFPVGGLAYTLVKEVKLLLTKLDEENKE